MCWVSLLKNWEVKEGMSVYLRLFWEFFKTGLFAVGGGMATLPFLHDIGRGHRLVHRRPI